MANNYCQFSEVIEDITPREAKWIKEFLLSGEFIDADDEEGYKKWCEEHGLEDGDDLYMYPGFEWDLEKGETLLWLSSGEGCNTQYLAHFVQTFLKKFRPNYIFTVTGADYCSKLRVGEFGGWWMAISAKKVLCGNSWDAAADAKKELRSSCGTKRKRSHEDT